MTAPVAMTANVKKKIRIMVVDDHFVVRMGLTGSVNVEPDMTAESRLPRASRPLPPTASIGRTSS